MFPRLVSLSSIGSVVLIVLLIVPANAASSLLLGSNANYNLSVNINETQSCNASPVFYNQTACGPPPPPPPFVPWSFRDEFNYTSITQLEAAGWGIESIAPLSYYSVGNSTLRLLNDGVRGAGAGHSVPGNSSDWSVSARVDWIGTSGNVSGNVGSLQVAVQTKGHSYDWMADGFYGHFDIGMDGYNVVTTSAYSPQLNVWHILGLDMIGGTLYGYFDGLLITTYTIPDSTIGNTDLINIQALASWETNNKFDYMQANNLPYVPPTPVVTPVSSLPITLSGNVGWTVVGLDKNTAVLNITHLIKVTLDSVPITPVTETGSFQQSVDLATRVESPGTSTQLVAQLLPLLSAGLYSTTSSGSSLPSSWMSSMNTSKMYTIWWVNGPLSNGSPVQILTGYSSVQGSESFNVPGSIGLRSAWIVTSSATEDLSATTPPSGLGGSLSSSDVNTRLGLKFDYDQSSSLLLASSDAAVVTTTAATTYTPGQVLCGVYGQCITVSGLATVSHITTMKITVLLTLSSTSVNLGQPLSGSSQSNSMLSALQNFVSSPLVYSVALVGAGAIASVTVFITRQRSRKTPPATGVPQQPTSPLQAS